MDMSTHMRGVRSGGGNENCASGGGADRRRATPGARRLARVWSAEMPQTLNVGARSYFVTATAWAFIVLAALACASALVQNAAVASVMPGLPPIGEAARLPLLTGLLVGYLPWVMGAGLLLSGATLASAIGLLLRLD